MNPFLKKQRKLNVMMTYPSLRTHFWVFTICQKRLIVLRAKMIQKIHCSSQPKMVITQDFFIHSIKKEIIKTRLVIWMDQNKAYYPGLSKMWISKWWRNLKNLKRTTNRLESRWIVTCIKIKFWQKDWKN